MAITDIPIQHIAEIFARELESRGIGTRAAREDDVRDKKEKQKGTKEEIKLLKEKARIEKEHLNNAKTLNDQLVKNAKGEALSAREKYKAEQRIVRATTKYESALNQSITTQKEYISSLDSAISTIGTKAGSLAKDFFSFGSMVTLAGVGIGQAANDFRAQMKYGADATVSFTGQMQRALALGVDPELLSELQAKTRATVIAMGGAANWTDKLTTAQRSLYTYIGDLDETVRFTTDALQTMRLAGIQPTVDNLVDANGNLVGLGAEFVKIQKMTGATFQEINAMMQEYIDNEDVRYRLLGAQDKTRRIQIFEEIAQRHELLVGLGMTAERAKAAGQALEQIAGKGPKERMREAAKLQATMGAMGMGQEGAKAADIIRKGRRATKEEQTYLADTLGKMNEKVAQSQTESLGKEMFTSALMQQSGIDSMLQPFVNLGTDFAEGQKKAAEPTNKTMAEEFPKMVTATYESSRVLKAVKDSPLVKLSGALIAGVGAMALEIPMITATLGAWFTLWKAQGSLMGSAGFKGKTKGMLGAAGRGLVRGGLGVAAAMGGNALLDQVWTPESTVGATAKSVTSSAMMGAGVGATFGPLGAAIGAAAGGLWGLYEATTAVNDAENAATMAKLQGAEKEAAARKLVIDADTTTNDEQKASLKFLVDQNLERAKNIALEEKAAAIKKMGTVGPGPTWMEKSVSISDLATTMGNSTEETVQLMTKAIGESLAGPAAEKARIDLVKKVATGGEFETAGEKALIKMLGEYLTKHSEAQTKFNDLAERMGLSTEQQSKLSVDQINVMKQIAESSASSDEKLKKVKDAMQNNFKSDTVALPNG